MGKQLSAIDRNDFEKVFDAVNNLGADAVKYYHKDNLAAGTRLSKGLREIEKLCKDARKGVYALKKERWGKKRGLSTSEY